MQENHIPEYINFCGENWKLLNFTSKRKKKNNKRFFCTLIKSALLPDKMQFINNCCLVAGDKCDDCKFWPCWHWKTESSAGHTRNMEKKVWLSARSLLTRIYISVAFKRWDAFLLVTRLNLISGRTRLGTPKKVSIPFLTSIDWRRRERGPKRRRLCRTTTCDLKWNEHSRGIRYSRKLCVI